MECSSHVPAADNLQQSHDLSSGYMNYLFFLGGGGAELIFTYLNRL